jgi:2-methylcitrate dehydratase
VNGAAVNRAGVNGAAQPDELLVELAHYALAPHAFPRRALETARLVLADSLGCAALASTHPACTRLLGPIVPGTLVPNGSRVPATSFELDPVKAAFDTGTLIRWLDYNDTWLAAEWGHPSDNLGAILALGDHLARTRKHVSVKDVLEASVVAPEIQGVLQLDNPFNRVGLDHVLLVEVASTAAAGRLLGLTEAALVSALSNAWVDGHPLRTYRHAPNTGSRKSWAAGDATSRGVRLALMAAAGELGCPTALSAPNWGFNDVRFGGNEVTLGRALGSYVMENILFKVAFPAEFHAQTAAEAAIRLHPSVAGRVEEIDHIEVWTQESALRIIDKRGPLVNPADRDHSLQYVIAVGLLYGAITDQHYEDEFAADPRIDVLRDKMAVTEDPRFTRDYLDPAKRTIANAIRVVFSDGTATERLDVEVPLGHPQRRDESLPHLREKLRTNLGAAYGSTRSQSLVERLLDDPDLTGEGVDELLTLLVA